MAGRRRGGLQCSTTALDSRLYGRSDGVSKPPAARQRALHAALAMQRRLAESVGERLSLRIGVNTGEVVLGRGREGNSFVTGDTVNVASRLEAAAGPGEILVGERTANAVRGAFEFTASRRIDAKGKPQGVPCRPAGASALAHEAARRPRPATRVRRPRRRALNYSGLGTTGCSR